MHHEWLHTLLLEEGDTLRPELPVTRLQWFEAAGLISLDDGEGPPCGAETFRLSLACAFDNSKDWLDRPRDASSVTLPSVG